MGFKIVDKEYNMEAEGRNPEVMGYIEGYTSNTVGHTFLRINCMKIPDEEMYSCYKRTNSLRHFEFQVGQKYGTGVRLNRKQVCQLIWELTKWLIKGW